MRIEIRAEFDLPDDETEFQIFSKAREMYSAIVEVQEYLRRIRKYSEKDPTFDELDEAITTMLNQVNID